MQIYSESYGCTASKAGASCPNAPLEMLSPCSTAAPCCCLPEQSLASCTLYVHTHCKPLIIVTRQQVRWAMHSPCSAEHDACMRLFLTTVLTAGVAHHSPSPISSARYGCRGNPFWARGMTGVTRSAQGMVPWRCQAIHKPFSSRGTAMASPPFTAASGMPVVITWCILHLTIWGVEPVVTHQTSWLESTGVCGVQQIHMQSERHRIFWMLQQWGKGCMARHRKGCNTALAEDAEPAG